MTVLTIILGTLATASTATTILVISCVTTKLHCAFVENIFRQQYSRLNAFKKKKM